MRGPWDDLTPQGRGMRVQQMRDFKLAAQILGASRKWRNKSTGSQVIIVEMTQRTLERKPTIQVRYVRSARTRTYLTARFRKHFEPVRQGVHGREQA